MFTVIEDCSPYYIRYTHDSLDDIINISSDSISNVEFKEPFTHHVLPSDVSNELIKLNPLSQVVELKKKRVSMFVTKPGYYYRPHKDGAATKVSINYSVKILDDKCKTSWYSDAELSSYSLDVETLYSRELNGVDRYKHKPLKSLVVKPREVVLFNTNIWHDFDNSESTNDRMVLTFRCVDLSINFDHIKSFILKHNVFR
jgi:hypothetical protein